MTGEVPQTPQPAEWERLPEGGLFNVAAMSDAQITETYAALWERVDYALHEATTLSPERDNASHDMLERFAADLRGLAATDPQRVRDLLAGYIDDQSNTPSLIAAVGTTVESLVGFDYSFTKDALTYALGGHFRDSSYAQDYAHERAYEATIRLLRHRLTPEQVADFRGALDERGFWTPDFDHAAYGY